MGIGGVLLLPVEDGAVHVPDDGLEGVHHVAPVQGRSFDEVQAVLLEQGIPSNNTVKKVHEFPVSSRDVTNPKL